MSDSCYAVIRNIPTQFHSSDLRRFFSQVVEENLFKCFHFKHRPEVLQNTENGEKIKKSCSCVVAFSVDNHRKQVIEKYHNNNWIDTDGKLLKDKCFILKITIDQSSNFLSPYFTKAEQRRRKCHMESEKFTNEDILKLSELRPPVNVMPKGNVGTPIPTFLALIRDCKLPPKLIKSLRLVFPETSSKRLYGNVYLNYGGQVFQADNIDEDIDLSESKFESKNSSDTEESSDEDGGEEWDRHNALHNDTTSQERSKERLFEEAIELKWEKGGSGLVFYTDAQYWAEKDGDFDEQTTDDWDVDYSGYYGQTGDMDNRDFIKIMKEKRLRRGQKIPRNKYMEGDKQTFAGFERYTKGIGSTLLKRMGWEKGASIGTKSGITVPIEVEGQNSKEGLGYHGDKLQQDNHVSRGESYFSSRKKLPKKVICVDDFSTNKSVEPLASHSWIFPQFRSNLTSVSSKRKPLRQEERRQLIPGEDGIVISTVYDEKLDVDQDSGILRSQLPTVLKHREKSNFRSSCLNKNIKYFAENNSDKVPNNPATIDKNLPEKTIVKTGSKLVNPEKYKQHFDIDNMQQEYSDISNTGRNYGGLYSMTMQFVRPADKKDYLA